MTVEDLEDKLNECFEDFLSSIQKDSRFIRPVKEGDTVPEDWTFVYTTRGDRLIRNFKRRLEDIAFRYFPDEIIEIESYLYQEY